MLVRGNCSICFDVTARATLQVGHRPFWYQALVCFQRRPDKGLISSWTVPFPPPAKRQFRVGNNVWVGQKLSMACKKDAPAHHTLKQGQPHEHKIDKHFQHKTDTCFTCTVRHHWKTTCKNRNRFVVLTLFRLRFKLLCLALWFSRRWV